MPDISKVKLPSGNVYDIKDAYARELIAGGITFSVAWDGNSEPVVANIPQGVIVEYNGAAYTGTKLASSGNPGTFYLVKSGHGVNSYDEYVPANGSWEKLGTQEVDLSGLGELAYKNVINSYTDRVLGEDTTFSATVTPTTTNIKATASGTAVGANGTANAITGFGAHSTQTFVKSVTAETSNKLVTTTVPNVTSAGSASTWNFAMGTGSDSETLIITGANGSAPTLGTAKTVATGAVASNGAGSAVVTGVTIGESAAAITALGTPTTSACLTGVKVTSQPTIALATGATAGTGVVSVATGISSATVTKGTNDIVDAVIDVEAAERAPLG